MKPTSATWRFKSPGLSPAYGLGTSTATRSSVSSHWRHAAEPRAGDTTLTLAHAVTGWQPGDKLVLPDSNQYTFGSLASVS